MAKNPEFKVEIKLLGFVNRNTENSILYTYGIYIPWINALWRQLHHDLEEGQLQKSRGTTPKFFIFCQNQIKNVN